MKIDTFKYIFKRRNVSETLYSVSKMIAVYGYGEYANSACDRIADAGLLDGEHVQISFESFPDLLVDWIGVIKCEDILSGYIDIDELTKIEQLFETTHELVRINNSMLEALRKFSLVELLKLIKESLTSDIEEVKEKRPKVIKMVFAEIVSRSITNRILQKIKMVLTNFVGRIKYRDIYYVLNKFAAEFSEERKT